MSWQPIETAPRDGTHILIAFGQDAVCEAWFEDNDFDARPWRFLDTGGPQATAKGFVNASRDGFYGPSHWMPLPAAPNPLPEEVKS